MPFRKIILYTSVLFSGLFAHYIFTSRQNDIPLNKPVIEKLYPFEDHFLMKQYPEVSFNYKAHERALRRVKDFAQQAGNRSSGSWVVQGPGNLGARVNCIAVHPQNENIILIGYSEGGIWRTQNGGITWNPVFDDQLRLSIGDIEFDPNNPMVVYAGTGDPNVSGYPFIGDGLYKSTDGGVTWKYSGLSKSRIISQIRVSAVNPNILYVSAMGLPFEKNQDRGIFKSLDGGLNWEQVLFVNDSTGIIDLVLHPSNPDIVYASAWNRIRNNRKSLVSGPDAKIYKTTNGGQSWEVLSEGLPAGNHSRIGLVMYEADPNILYACYTKGNDFDLLGIYKTTDGGQSWTEVPTGPGTGMDRGIYAGFGWYFGKIRVNPKNPDDIFILGVDLYRTKNGGQSWEIATPPWWTYDVHADKHDLVWLKDHVLLATDGGVYKSRILSTDVWEDIENIPATQFYRVAYNPNYPDRYYGGAQDNGTSGGNAANINDWDRIFGGDGFQPVFHPTDPNIFYVETQNGGLAVTIDGGQSFQGARSGINTADPRNWDMPFMMSHHNPDVLYTGTDKIYKSESGPMPSWKAISPILTDPASNAFRKNISTIHESPTDSMLLYAGTSDGLVWTSRDGGSTWQNISNGLPRRYVSSVVASANGSVFVSFTGYRDNDFTPYIYRSDSGGMTWGSIQGTLPDIAINNILVLPYSEHFQNHREAVLFVATDGGVFWTKDFGQSWQRLGDNMPVIPVYDIDYNVANHQIIAGTFARSIQSFDLNQLDLTVSSKDTRGPEINFTIFPSVTNGAIYIRSGIVTPVDYNVISLSGQILHSGKLLSENQEINTTMLRPGVYFFRISENGRIRTRSFVKM